MLEFPCTGWHGRRRDPGKEAAVGASGSSFLPDPRPPCFLPTSVKGHLSPTCTALDSLESPCKERHGLHSDS